MTRRTLLQSALLAPLAGLFAPSGPGAHRSAPHRHAHRRGPSHLRGVPLSGALSVRRAVGRSRHPPQRHLPRAHQRRPRGVGLRVDDAGQRLGVSRRLAGCRARRDEGAGRRAARRSRPPATSSGHPVDLFRALEPAYLRAAAAVSRQRALPAPIPKLCTLVVASPFDAAIHDAYGKAFGVSAYDTYGPAFMGRDLSHDLGPAFTGEYLDRYVPSAPRAAHRRCSIRSAPATRWRPRTSRTRIEDGLPNTLEEWIPRDGLVRFKIKLNGGDLAADFERVVRIDRVVRRVQAARGVTDWKYSLDFNEGCPNVALPARVPASRPRGHARRLRSHPLHRAADRARPAARSRQRHARGGAARPVVIDESLTDLESLLLAREMGYTGVALKACKGQSQALLMAAAARSTACSCACRT